MEQAADGWHEHDWTRGYRHPTPWATEYTPETLPELLVRATVAHPDRPLIDFLGRSYSYAETLDGATRVAAGLAELGYRAGDRIGLFLPNVPHYVAAYYGILLMGGVVVNFSPLYTADELSTQVADSGTRALFTLSATALFPKALQVLATSGLERLIVGSVAGALPAGKSLFYRLFRRGEVAARPDDPRITAFSRLIDNRGDLPPAAVAADDLALIQYTGGTTGTPKGAMLTHQNLTANARQVEEMDGKADTDDRIAGVLPLFHVFANTCILNRTVVNGGTMALLPRFDAGQVLATVQRVRATALPGVPTMFQALLVHPRLARTDFSSLRFCISGGAPLPAELKQRWEAATASRLIEGYGLSESSGVVASNPYDAPGKPGTIGQPVMATRLRLADKEDATLPAPADEPGELLIAGPQVMQGYWRRPDADAAAFAVDADGTRWLRTGDMATIDADGFVAIVDRLKDMIAVSGFKVFPSQIEALLHHHPAVAEALVIGLPDAYRGERPRAYVTLHPGAAADEDELAAWLNPQLGSHERVDRVVIRDALPKTPIGKLSRKDLLAEVLAERRQLTPPAAPPSGS